MSARRSSSAFTFNCSAAVCRGTTTGAGISSGAFGGRVAGGLERRTSACTAGVEKFTIPRTRAIEEIPASAPTWMGILRLMLRVILRITIQPFYLIANTFWPFEAGKSKANRRNQPCSSVDFG
jgi:hypothetical protein